MNISLGCKYSNNHKTYFTVDDDIWNIFMSVQDSEDKDEAVERLFSDQPESVRLSIKDGTCQKCRIKSH